MTCGLIAEEDEEFGSVVEVRLKHEKQDSEICIEHLRRANQSLICQQETLLTLLSTYHGINFTSSLTKEFLKMFGVTPRFNTTGHTETADMVDSLGEDELSGR